MTLPKALTPVNVNSFAYKTIKDRLPVTITKAVDLIHRQRLNLMSRFGQDADEDCKTSVEYLSKLRYELMTDKPLRPVEQTGSDYQLWNDSLTKLKKEVGEENCTWFKASWLYSECYVYRRILEAMLACKSEMRHYDPYESVKLETLETQKQSISGLVESLCTIEESTGGEEHMKKRFEIILKSLLWSNKNDMSLSSGNDVSSKVHNLIEMVESLDENLLTDHTASLWSHLSSLRANSSTKSEVRVDIVLDNCGIELASDLIFTDFLLYSKLVDKVYLHGKAYSWFVSDVLKYDFEALLEQLKQDSSPLVQRFHARLEQHLRDGTIEADFSNPFWTLPYPMEEMESIVPDFYATLKEQSALVVLKGDLNYRKLIRDLDWPLDTPLKQAVGRFLPTSICAIRTLKADLAVNIDTNDKNFGLVRKKFDAEDKSWMITGDYGVIQFLKH